MNRDQLIKICTQYELQWFLDQQDQQWVSDMTDFFAKGGFTTWTTEQLQAKYALQIAEEV